MSRSLIIVQDDLQENDVTSFDFMEKLFKACRFGILFIGILRSADWYTNVMISEKHVQDYVNDIEEKNPRCF